MRTHTADRRRRAAAHTCRHCHRPWALRVIAHPAGLVIRCRHCGTARRAEEWSPGTLLPGVPGRGGAAR